VISQLIIGSRDSKLALVQSYWVRDQLLAKYPELKITIKEIKTQGDKILDVALAKIGDKGLFTKELENELLAGTIDIAVHSMKDLPTTLPEGLEIAVTTEREDVRDVVCFSEHAYKRDISSLAQAKTIATSSLRRTAQLKRLYPDKTFVDMRGNLQTRFKKLDDPANKIDAMILAAAGLLRLELDTRIDQYLDPSEVLPAVGQGALAIEMVSGRHDLKDFLRAALNSYTDEMLVKAERAFLRELEGGCQVPIGVLSSLSRHCEEVEDGRSNPANGSPRRLVEAPRDDGKFELTGTVTSLNGQEQISDSIEGELKDAEKLGQELGRKIKAKGADKILAEIRVEA
jgi:hydroxymethylbilane synthase